MAAKRSERFRSERGGGSVVNIGGRWWIQRSRTITLPNGRKQRKRWREGPFRTKADAQAAQRSLAPVSDLNAQRITWDEFLEGWLAGYVAELLAEERRSYAASLTRQVNLHLRPRIGRIVVSETSADDIKRLWRDLLNPSDGDKARSTVLNIRGALSLASKAAIAQGLLPAHLSSLPRLPRAGLRDVEKAKDRRMRILTPEGAAWVAQAALEGLFEEWSGPTLVALDTGCRRGEALGLKWPDLNFERSEIHFVRQVLQESSQPDPGFALLKNRQDRIVAVPSRTMDMLRERHAAAGYPVNGLVFADENGDLLHPDGWTHDWGSDFRNRFPAIAGTTPHDLRHTHASLLLRDGASIVEVADRLGHSTPATTLNRYAHTLPGDSRLTSERWERILGS